MHLNDQSGGLVIDWFEWIGLILIVKDILVYQKLVKERTVQLFESFRNSIRGTD